MMNLRQIADLLGAELIGDGEFSISRINTLENAKGDEISFLANKKYVKQLAQTNAGAVILHPAQADQFNGNRIVIGDPYLAYAKLAQAMDTTPLPAKGVHPSAHVDDSAVLGKNVELGANVVVEAGVVLGDNVVVGPGCYIGHDAKLGNNVKIWPNTTIYHRVEIGNNVIIHANTVIGSDGFGFANNKGEWVKIPQLGSVVIGNNVEIGSSTTIDRGALGNTEIHDNVILDNQIQIAHNVVIGEGTAMAACSVIAGSTKVGKNCQIAGLCGINGHIEICDGVILTGMAMVISSIDKPGVYSSGVPHSENKDWRRQMAQLRQIGTLNQRVKTLEKELNTQQEQN